MKLRSSWSLVSLFAILVAVGIVSAVILIQQTQPAVPIQGGMTALCANTSATPNNVTLGSNGQETFSCDSAAPTTHPDRKSTRLNSSHLGISYAVFCLKKKKKKK